MTTDEQDERAAFEALVARKEHKAIEGGGKMYVPCELSSEYHKSAWQARAKAQLASADVDTENYKKALNRNTIRTHTCSAALSQPASQPVQPVEHGEDVVMPWPGMDIEALFRAFAASIQKTANEHILGNGRYGQIQVPEEEIEYWLDWLRRGIAGIREVSALQQPSQAAMSEAQLMDLINEHMPLGEYTASLSKENQRWNKATRDLCEALFAHGVIQPPSSTTGEV